jgi:imidazoleglycerol-phosphate dehydratase
MMRVATVLRETKETNIEVTLDLDGTGQHDVQTPLPFLTHMVEQLSRHGLFDLTVRARGDVEIDGHHTTEDLGFVVGQCVAKALDDRRGIRRYGWALLPMDEARVSCALDLCGRPFFVWEVPLPKAAIGGFDVELAEVFFEAFARGAMCNLHVVKERGDNLHHIVEVSFKALAKALEAATRLDPRVTGVPSTKGTLTA